MPKKMTRQSAPDYSRETLYQARGLGPVAGVDEAGRGPLAGPVVVAACILNPDAIPEGLNDSKKLTSTRRAILFDRIRATSQSAIVIVSARVIDETNIRAATLKGMVEAVHALPVKPGAALVDGRDWPNMPCVGEAVIKGDALSLSIAAASILAKVTRDRLMNQANTFWPGYGFDKHAGYGTAAHLDALAKHGPTPIHRMSFAPLKS
ncbi:MAG: ribonuclease HII [Alphaproteobacteria bacterium]|nr:ribonuclease HII [Alphaproteobacteria bacterium]